MKNKIQTLSSLGMNVICVLPPPRSSVQTLDSFVKSNESVCKKNLLKKERDSFILE